MSAQRNLDCTGLFCPMPIVNTKREMETMASGDVLEIVADDPGFEKDLPAWCSATGNECVSVRKEGAAIKGLVRKK